LTAAKKH